MTLQATTPDDVQFDQPTAVAIDTAGNVFMADTENSRIQKFDNDGTPPVPDKLEPQRLGTA